MGETGVVQLNLISGFALVVDGDEVEVGSSTQRVLAYLALRPRPQARITVASALWLDHTQPRASANLRTALWRLNDLRDQLVTSRGGSLSLAASVRVDVAGLVREARALIEPSVPDCDTGTALSWDGVDHLAGDLLPEWDEDWILFERERLRQLCIHAREALCRRLVRVGRLAEAVDAGLSAVSADPMRESAHRALIEAYLAERNVADARRQFDAFAAGLWESLRLSPSGDLARLVGLPVPAPRPV